MSSSVVLVITVLIAALGVAYVIGRLLTLRAGMLKAAGEASNVDTSGLGLSSDGPTIVHFTATWCGPCAAVRRVVDQVCAELPGVAHVEIDMDANPEATAFGAVAADHADFRCRRTAAISHHRRARGHRPAVGPGTAVGLITVSLGKLSGVSTRIEPMLTKRRAVDLCRVAGCCCCCCSC
jgi:thiol-disulfide isomerase/thioredoxin